MSTGAEARSALDMAVVKAEFPPPADGSRYLNTGSCGRKPQRVLSAIADDWRRFNNNPMLSSFYSEDDLNQARARAAQVIGGTPDNLLLTQNSTQGLQMVLQSFLLKAGDELVTTTHEHGSVRTDYARQRLVELPSARIRTPDVDGETTGMFTVTWNPDHIKVKDLKEWLWDERRIWVQPDYYFGDPGHGMRLSCHYSLDESDIDKLIDALRAVII